MSQNMISCKLGFAVAYRFCHNTCNSGLFLLTMWSKDAYLRGVPYGGSNRHEPVQSGSVQSGFTIPG
jgi:hypothetical protein